MREASQKGRQLALCQLLHRADGDRLHLLPVLLDLHTPSLREADDIPQPLGLYAQVKLLVVRHEGLDNECGNFS